VCAAGGRHAVLVFILLLFLIGPVGVFVLVLVLVVVLSIGVVSYRVVSVVTVAGVAFIPIVVVALVVLDSGGCTGGRGTLRGGLWGIVGRALRGPCRGRRRGSRSSGHCGRSRSGTGGASGGRRGRERCASGPVIEVVARSADIVASAKKKLESVVVVRVAHVGQELLRAGQRRGKHSR
jgi:hypothetical protein